MNSPHHRHHLAHPVCLNLGCDRAIRLATDSVTYIFSSMPIQFAIGKALRQGGSPATLDDPRKRFETFLNDPCKSKDASKLRFVIS